MKTFNEFLTENKKLESAGKKHGFTVKGGHDERFGYIPSTASTAWHHSSEITKYVRQNSRKKHVFSHFNKDERNQGNAGNQVLHDPKKYHKLIDHPEFPEDQRNYIKFKNKK